MPAGAWRNTCQTRGAEAGQAGTNERDVQGVAGGGGGEGGTGVRLLLAALSREVDAKVREELAQVAKTIECTYL